MKPNPQSFAGRMLPPLEELAGQLLQRKEYHRLHLIAELLDVFSSGAWERLGDDERRLFIAKMESDFHIRAWDDWDLDPNNPLSRVISLLASASKAINK